MNELSKRRVLLKALREAKATPLQIKMTAILFAVNGIGNALGFVKKIKALNIEKGNHGHETKKS